MPSLLRHIPKIWAVVFMYFLVVACLVLTFKAPLFFSPAVLTNRLVFLAAFFVTVLWYKKYGGRPWFALFEYVLIYALLALLYRETALLNGMLLMPLDPALAKADAFLFGAQPSLTFRELLPQTFFRELFSFGYLSYYFLPLGCFFVLYKKMPQRIAHFGFVLVSSFLIYYLIFILLPAVGPQYYFSSPAGEDNAGGIFGSVLRSVQRAWEVPTAAFPSSHVGIGCIVALWVHDYLPGCLKYFLPFVLLLMPATVYIKAHYAVDVFAGTVSAPLIYFLSLKIYCSLSDLR